jgi:hypothetical protein
MFFLFIIYLVYVIIYYFADEPLGLRPINNYNYYVNDLIKCMQYIVQQNSQLTLLKQAHLREEID